MIDDYARWDALGLAEQIRHNHLSPTEAVDAAIARAEAVNPSLGAIVTPLYDYARERPQRRLAGPFAHVPFLLKDAHHALAGTPMSNGSALQKGEISTRDAEIVRRYLGAGLVAIGKTNTPEYKLSVTTNPVAWGPTRNPFDVARTPGGSSGGSAVAVATGIVPMASATDEGGSIRIPAAGCGVFGLKPSRGRNPVGPNFRWKLEGCSTSHLITRTVRDSAAALDATSGPEPGSPYSCPGPTGFLAGLAEPAPALRIAVSMDDRAFGRPIEAPCVDAIGRAANLLSDLGHEVDEVALPFDEGEALRLNAILVTTSFAAFADDLAETYGRDAVQSQLEPINRFLWTLGAAIPSPVLEQAKLRARELGRELAEFHDRYDVFVTSTLGRVPPLAREAEPSTVDIGLAKLLASPLGAVLRLSLVRERIMDAQVDALASRLIHRTAHANITGQPAMSVPLHWTGAGVPVGVQFTGRFGEERTLLRLAAQLEEAQPWVPRLLLRSTPE